MSQLQRLVRWLEPARRRLGPLAAALRTLAGYFPATLAGLGVLALCAAGFWFLGVLHKDVVLLPATVAVAAVVVGMILSVGVGAAFAVRRWKNARFDDSVIRLEANYARRTPVELRVPLLPFVEVTWEWLTPPHVEARLTSRWTEITEEVMPRHRCLVDGVTRLVQVRDVLGMARVRWKVQRPTRVMILPDRGRLDQTTVLQSLIGGEDHPDPYGDAHGDRVEMRQYAPGDSARSILWKVYARNRRLMVRIPERALTARPRTCAYMVAGPADEASAGLARVVLERRMLGDGWRFGADGSPGHADNVDDSLEMLARSGNPEAGPVGLATFLQRAEADGFQSCLVFVPAGAGPWMEAVRRIAGGSRLGLTFLMAIDDTDAALRRAPLWKRLLLRPERTDSVDPGAVAEALQSVKTPMVLCDRHDGRVVDDARRYLAARRAR